MNVIQKALNLWENLGESHYYIRKDKGKAALQYVSLYWSWAQGVKRKHCWSALETSNDLDENFVKTFFIGSARRPMRRVFGLWSKFGNGDLHSFGIRSRWGQPEMDRWWLSHISTKNNLQKVDKSSLSGSESAEKHVRFWTFINASYRYLCLIKMFELIGWDF